MTDDAYAISVIIPLFNKEKTIALTLESVLSQTVQNFEIIVVNDGSTDNSLNVVNAFDDVRIKTFTTENKGVSHARNYAVSKSENSYVAFIDADDYWYPFHLENLVSSIEKFPAANWFVTAYEIYHNSRLCLPIDVPLMKNGSEWIGEVNDFFANSMRDAIAWTSAICMKKSFFVQLSGFDERLRNNQDTDLWIRAALYSNLIFLSRISARYVKDGGGHISQKNIEKKTVMDFDKYEQKYPDHKALKYYLDCNRYAVALRYKIAGNRGVFLDYYRAIDVKNLSGKQRLLLKLPTLILRLLMRWQSILEKCSIRWRTH